MSDAEHDITLAEVAARLHHSALWLQWQLAEDRNRDHPVLQHHHHIGRKPLWTEAEFALLKTALIEQEKERRAKEKSVRPGWKSSSATATGTSTEPSVLVDTQSACAAVLALRPGQTLAPKRSTSSAKSRPNTSQKSSTGSSRRARLGLRLIGT